MSQNSLRSSLTSSHLLERFFKDFYYTLLSCKELALRAARSSPAQDEEGKTDAETEAPQETAPEEPVEKIPPSANSNRSFASPFPDQNVPVQVLQAVYEAQQRLQKTLAAQTEQVLHLLDQTDTLQFREAQYAMVAIADEVFLNLPWSGKAAWSKQLLEGQLFQSQSAGAQIFQRIDTLLSKYDPARMSIAKIYFQILALGFRGQHNDAQDDDVIRNYMRRLYVFIYGRDPMLDQYGTIKLLPDCYEHTMESDIPVRMPGVRFWTKVVIGVLLGYIFISSMVWFELATDLHKPLDTLFTRFQDFLNAAGK